VPFGANQVRAGFAAIDGKGPLGYVYNLSKRTALYATYASINNDGGAKYGVDPDPPLPAGGKSTGYEAGVRHSF